MIDLNKLDKEIDSLFENETGDSLTKWLLSKRFGNIYNLIGKGTFVSLNKQSEAIFVTKKTATFNQDSNYSPDSPINRKAA